MALPIRIVPNFASIKQPSGFSLCFLMHVRYCNQIISVSGTPKHYYERRVSTSDPTWAVAPPWTTLDYRQAFNFPLGEASGSGYRIHLFQVELYIVGLWPSPGVSMSMSVLCEPIPSYLSNSQENLSFIRFNDTVVTNTVSGLFINMELCSFSFLWIIAFRI